VDSYPIADIITDEDLSSPHGVSNYVSGASMNHYLPMIQRVAAAVLSISVNHYRVPS